MKRYYIRTAFTGFAILLLVRQPLRAEETLRDAAGKHLLIGCAMTTRDISNPQLSALIPRQFSCITMITILNSRANLRKPSN